MEPCGADAGRKTAPILRSKEFDLGSAEPAEITVECNQPAGGCHRKRASVTSFPAVAGWLSKPGRNESMVNCLPVSNCRFHPE
jgi:hypothetical protein